MIIENTNQLTAIGCGVSVIIEIVLIVWAINYIKQIHKYNDGNNDKSKK